jgi:hypothetical protein
MNNDLSNSTAEKTVNFLLIDDLQDKNLPVEVLKLFLYEEKEIELDCLNNEIDTINLAFDLGFRLIEIITIDDGIIADQYFKELLIYKKDKFDLITDILKRNNVNFHY